MILVIILVILGLFLLFAAISAASCPSSDGCLAPVIAGFLFIAIFIWCVSASYYVTNELQETTPLQAFNDGSYVHITTLNGVQLYTVKTKTGTIGFNINDNQVSFEKVTTSPVLLRYMTVGTKYGKRFGVPSNFTTYVIKHNGVITTD